MSKPGLNCTDRDSGSFPPTSASFSETMQEEVSADGVCLTGDFNGAFAIVPALDNSGDALAAVKAGFEGNSLEFLEEVAVRFIVSVNEYPSSVWSLLSAFPKESDEARRNGDAALLVILGSEAYVLFLPDVKFHSLEVNVHPTGELDFLFATCGSKKELVADCIFVGHNGEQLSQFFVSKGNWWVILEGWEVLSKRKACLNSVFFEQRKNRHDSIVQCPRFVAAGGKVIAKFPEGLLGYVVEELRRFSTLEKLV